MGIFSFIEKVIFKNKNRKISAFFTLTILSFMIYKFKGFQNIFNDVQWGMIFLVLFGAWLFLAFLFLNELFKYFRIYFIRNEIKEFSDKFETDIIDVELETLIQKLRGYKITIYDKGQILLGIYHNMRKEELKDSLEELDFEYQRIKWKWKNLLKKFPFFLYRTFSFYGYSFLRPFGWLLIFIFLSEVFKNGWDNFTVKFCSFSWLEYSVILNKLNIIAFKSEQISNVPDALLSLAFIPLLFLFLLGLKTQFQLRCSTRIVRNTRKRLSQFYEDIKR